MYEKAYNNKGLLNREAPTFENAIEVGKIKHLDRSFYQDLDDNLERIDESVNNGGSTDYYKLPTDSDGHVTITDFDDFSEWRNLNGFQFNIGKVVWTFNTGRHSGTTYERDLNKIIHYANKELQRISRGKF